MSLFKTNFRPLVNLQHIGVLINPKIVKIRVMKIVVNFSAGAASTKSFPNRVKNFSIRRSVSPEAFWLAGVGPDFGPKSLKNKKY